MVVWRTRSDHALGVVGMLEQVDLWQSGIPLLWYNLSQESHKSDENKDLYIHKGVLVGHHDHNYDKHTLPW